MGDTIALQVTPRTITGKKVKQLRKQGLVPIVVYGGAMEATSVSADAVAATKAWHTAGKHQVIQLTIDGKKRLAVIKTVDFEPVKHSIRHLGLQVVKQNEKIETVVPVRVQGEGETPAEKTGLVVLKTIESVEISALPKNLPDFMQVPGDNLVAENDHVTVADIIAVDGVTVLSDPEQVVATVYEPSALAAANEAAGGTATEETEVPVEGEEQAEEASDATEVDKQ